LRPGMGFCLTGFDGKICLGCKDTLNLFSVRYDSINCRRHR
jgi:hypothetical protein